MAQEFETDLAPTLLELTEDDEFSLHPASDDSLLGTVHAAENTPPGEYLDTPVECHLEFTAAGIAFELTMRYRKDVDGHPHAESVDLELVKGHDWSIYAY